jgi:hypothetical protein
VSTFTSIPTINLCVVLVLTLVSGWSDSQGFLQASTIWVDGYFNVANLARSAVGFAGGIGAYWLALPFLINIGVVAPELQSLLWFVVTMVGVAVTSGAFLGWRPIDQLIAVAVLCGLGWLITESVR